MLNGKTDGFTETRVTVRPPVVVLQRKENTMRVRSKAISMHVMLSTILFCSLAFAGEQTNEEILVQDNSAFAIDLYQKLSVADDNIFFSPYSISTALAMTYAGARGNTEKEMSKTLRFSLSQDNLHPAFADIESKLNNLQKAGNVNLSVANSLWPQQDYTFLDDYLSLIKHHYGVSITPVDYKRACETARKMINKWVEDKTQDKIKDLIQPGILDALTRLVLVNAIYFKGNWESQFKPERTKNAPFYVSPDKSVQVPMMTQKREFRYAEIERLKVLELPYEGGELSMIILLPSRADGIRKLESNLTVENLKQWKHRLRKREVLVFLPKFTMTSTFRLDKTLVSMGMVDAFNDSKANFAGMDGRPDWLYIGAVLHKAFVDVNEEGTEAAAATAVVMKARAMPAPPPTFRADHPFLFLICENQTGSILFMGRVNDPTKTGE
jgi:serpin B